MESKTTGTTLAAFAVAVALLGAAPVASAATGVDTSNDGVTRTFGAYVGAEATFKDFGTGIYDAGATQVCPISVLGLRAVGPEFFYYQDGRVATNLKTGTEEFMTQTVVPLGTPCPIPGTTGGNQNVVVEDLNVAGAYDSVGVDQLLCGQQSFLDCFPQPSTGLMEVSACHYTDAAFTQSVPHDGKGGLIGGSLGPLGLLSRSIDCDGGNWNNPTTYYDGVALCPDFFFDVGIWGTAFCLVQNNDIVAYGDGSSYLVSCMEIDYNAVNTVTGTSTLETAVSHDYTLVHDVAWPYDWENALDWHSGTGAFAHPNDPAAGLLQGWHDLGGKNGCPDVASVDFDEDAKKGEDVAGQIDEFIKGSTSNSCTASGSPGQDASCTFVCPAAPLGGTITVTVDGDPGASVSGSATCSSGTASCSGTGTCTGEAAYTSLQRNTGSCSASTNSGTVSVTCSAA